ncbi:MAG: DUF2007 domain-containing protein [Acidobacteria bacterium]|nr:DUF2007 domain-containing protein [Acidobacteriota bacterium]
MTSDHDQPDPQEALIPVWRTTEATVVPHVLAALEQAGIEYMVQDRGLASELIGHRSTLTVGETAPPLSVLVREEDEGRAREIITTLLSPVISGPIAIAADEQPPLPAAPVGPGPTARSAGASDGALELVDSRTGAVIGRITDAQLAELTRHLELESVDDTDVYIDQPTIDMLRAAGVNAATADLLTRALGASEGVDVRWVRRR